uniref:Uncharacterized protein n=1 Tax=Tanacetum cinerariifolium TaxID=118510 RepID=A0A6L2KM78_TANCI|nr:hypothetical protein [Tanacetum cinerariifolium]
MPTKIELALEQSQQGVSNDVLNTHVVVWRNKVDLDTMSMDDLYNNLTMYEPEVKEMSSSSSSTQNMAFVSSSNNNTSSTNGVVNTAHRVSTASTQVNAAYSTNIDNLSDAVICSFFASQPNSPQLVHEDLGQIHPNDMEEMDLRWQMAMLTMRARRFLKKTGRKLIVNGNKTIGYENYNEVLPLHKGNFMPSTPDLSFTGFDEFVNKPVLESCKSKSSKEEPKPQIEKKSINPSIAKIEFVKSKQQEKTGRKIVKQFEQHRQNTHSAREVKNNTARPKAVVDAVKGNNSNAVKASACKTMKRYIEDIFLLEGIDCLPNSTIFEQLTLMGMIRNLDNVSGKFRMYPSLQNKVIDLEKTMTTQRNEIDSLKRRFKKLEKKNRSRTHKLKRLYKVGLTARVESFGNEESLGEDASKQRRIDAIDADEEIILVSVQDKVVSNDVDKEIFDVNVLGGEDVFVVGQNENVVEEVKGIVFQEPGKSTTTTISSQKSQDKVKGIMIEEPVKPKKKYQIRLDEEAAKKLQAEFDEEERLAREKAEKEERANIEDPQRRKEIVRADGKSQMYMIFSQMLKSFDREDLEDLYKLVKAKYGSKRLVEIIDYLLWSNLKIMFEPHVKDESMQIYMLVEKKYPLTPPTLLMMLEKKKLDDFKEEYQVYGRIVRIKSLLDVVGVTAAQVYVNTTLIKRRFTDLCIQDQALRFQAYPIS